MKTALIYLATNLWWPFIGGVIVAAVCWGFSSLVTWIRRRT